MRDAPFSRETGSIARLESESGEPRLTRQKYTASRDELASWAFCAERQEQFTAVHRSGVLAFAAEQGRPEGPEPKRVALLQTKHYVPGVRGDEVYEAGSCSRGCGWRKRGVGGRRLFCRVLVSPGEPTPCDGYPGPASNGRGWSS